MGVQSKQSKTELGLLHLIFAQTRGVSCFRCQDKTCHFCWTTMCKYYFQWRLTWQRGVCLISDLGLMLRKHCLTVSDILRLTLTQLVSPNTLRSNIKLSSTSSGVENTNHCTAQADVMIGWNIFVCCLITDVLLYLSPLSVSILYLIIFVSAEIYLPLLVIK